MPNVVKSEPPKEAQFSRRFPRRQYQNKLGVLHMGLYQEETGVEIGEGGLLFVSPRKFAVGQHVVLNFYVPKGGFVGVKAQILYMIPNEASLQKSTSFSYGVKFNNLAFECRRMIRDYIAEKTYNEAAVS